MISVEIERRIRSLSQYDLTLNNFSIGLAESLSEQPFIEFSRTSYPGVEAHLFTIADISLWRPELTETSEVVLQDVSEASDRVESWNRLFTSTHIIMTALNTYREGLKQGIIPTTNWIHYEFQWYRQNWDTYIHESSPIHEFLSSVDKSIQPHIKELNELGFPTTQSCSGLSIDHPDRDPYLPYVMFDERAYPKVSAHLFTLADMTGWIPSYGPHNFDVELRLSTSEQAENRWDMLIKGARHLASLLTDYRLLSKTNSYRHEREKT